MSNSTPVVTPLTERKVESIRNDLLSSMNANPKMSDDERAVVTRRIARSRKVTVQQVAGVRAALTRGRYGTLKTLLRQNKAASAS